MSAARRILRDDRGAVSIEFTTLVPFFVMFLVFFADATMVYLTHSEMYNTVREVSRGVSTGELRDLTEVEAFAAERLLLGSRDYYINVDFSGDKTVAIGIHLYDAAIFGFFLYPILGKELVAVATVGEEPRIE